ncbi:hypothetical protein PX554_13660 [Sphingomonas sp. H39-1-10]|uniref:hypothetical protein n=1 Tax=Sphingomonas pollutisoli TaxID=3030829 RepID=UPI0023B8B3CF|nr:hypothetical protein [Sphingomonas pollutisoli]MDF0489182.1 hypothetical protein [Sphingomonas pollutisoli]
MSEKPFGWRPFTEERRRELANEGFSAEAIATMEESSVYSPVENAVWALELGVAILHAAGKRFGPDFALDVKETLERRAERLRSSEHVEDKVEAPILDTFIESMDWQAVITRASDPNWGTKRE